MKTLLVALAVLISLDGGACALELPLPAGWRDIDGVRQGAEGSCTLFGPFKATSLDQAIAQRVVRLSETGTKLSEKKRESIQAPGGLAGCKIVYEISRNEHIYLSPHYFFMTGANEFFVMKTIPDSVNYEANAKAIEEHILKTIASARSSVPAPQGRG